MPLYMDLHILPGVKAEEVAEAHRRDMLIQNDHACKCMTYWIDEKRGNVFCLIEAPDKEAVETMHGNAHGLIPNKIIEVNDSLVESFLGRITDPENAIISNDGLKVFSDSSFRILVLIRSNDLVLLQHNLGKGKTNELLNRYHKIIRKNLSIYEGNEIENNRHDFVASFMSANKAITFSLAIKKILAEENLDVIGFKIAITAGEPVAKNEQLFGDTIQLAERMCTVAKKLQLVISSSVKELISKNHFQSNEYGNSNDIIILTPTDEELLGLLFNKLEENWTDADFNVADYCQSIAISKSQLYRKVIALTGFSPNFLLKEFRLEKALALMKAKRYNIAETTFNSGFTSPSYFTKCFKKKFGITPMAYLGIAQEHVAWI